VPRFLWPMHGVDSNAVGSLSDCAHLLFRRVPGLFHDGHGVCAE